MQKPISFQHDNNWFAGRFVGPLLIRFLTYDILLCVCLSVCWSVLSSFTTIAQEKDLIQESIRLDRKRLITSGAGNHSCKPLDHQISAHSAIFSLMQVSPLVRRGIRLTKNKQSRSSIFRKYPGREPMKRSKAWNAICKCNFSYYFLRLCIWTNLHAFGFLFSAFCCDCGLGSFNSFDVMFWLATCSALCRARSSDLMQSQ